MVDNVFKPQTSDEVEVTASQIPDNMVESYFINACAEEHELIIDALINRLDSIPDAFTDIVKLIVDNSRTIHRAAFGIAKSVGNEEIISILNNKNNGEQLENTKTYKDVQEKVKDSRAYVRLLGPSRKKTSDEGQDRVL